MEKDVLPLILTYHTPEHTQVSLDAVKLLVFLTLPPDDDASNKITQKRVTRQALQTMFRFRAANGDAFAVLFSRLAGPLERFENSVLRLKDDDGRLVQLFVTFVRNLLLAAEAPRETRGEATVLAAAQRLRANLVKMLHDLRVLDALAQMAKDSRKKPFSEDSALLIETFHLLFASQSPSQLTRVLRKETIGDDVKGEGGEELDGAPEEKVPEKGGFEKDTGFDDPVDKHDETDDVAPVVKPRSFIDTCRAKSTQMRHGRFGGATAKIIAKAAVGTGKRKSLIGSDLRFAPGGYFGEKVTGGGGKRGKANSGKNGAVLTADTVGAFTADIEGLTDASGGDLLFQHPVGERDVAARFALAKFANQLADGGFNEILLAAWNQLRHLEHISGVVSSSEEHSSRVHSFLGIAHFFVVFARLRLATRDGSVADEHKTRSDVASVSNLFDKHVFHWMRMSWDGFVEAGDKKGLVLVSGVMNEMLLFLDAIFAKGSASDKFACEALVAETCAERSGDDDLLRFFASRVKKYETTDAPLVYLANITEALHLSHTLARKANPDVVTRAKTYFDPKTVENHVRLAAHWSLNPPSLNSNLARYFAETLEAEMALNLHVFGTLQTLHAVATETHGETRADLKLLRRVSAGVVTDFMRGLYQVEPEDGTSAKVPRQKYLDLVF